MDPKKRQQILLGVLGIGVGVAAYVNWPQSTVTPAAGNGTTARRQAATKAAARPGDSDVRIEALGEKRPLPGGSERNLFKFKPRYVPPPPPPPRPVAPPMATAPVGPPPAPPVPQIPLKFIGLIESPGSPRMAVLSDGRGAPVYGKEGDAVLGQYRITRIGAESIEMEHVDGRGRQTIRLSGS